MDLNESEDIRISTPQEITQAVASATASLLPEKSRSIYERQYRLFMEWRRKNKIDSFSENILLAYFQQLSTKMKPTSLWAIYSMLRMTLNINKNINVTKYPKLCAFLKRTSNGYKPKKSKILTPQQIRQFLLTAPDEKHLFTKVGLIFGIMGACRREELMRIETKHVEDLNTALLVHIPDSRNKTERQFVIGGNFYTICKKYMKLRPPNVEHVARFFLNYQRGKCTRQPIGINKFGSLASQVATFLKLPDPASYTGHCLRRSSGTILVDCGTDITVLKRQGGCRSTSLENNTIQTAENRALNTVENNSIENIRSNNFEYIESADSNFEDNESSTSSHQLTTNNSQCDVNNYSGRSLISFNNCKNISSIRVSGQWCNDTMPTFNDDANLTISEAELNNLRERTQEVDNDYNVDKAEFSLPSIKDEISESPPPERSKDVEPETPDSLTEMFQNPSSDIQTGHTHEADIFGEFVASQLKKIVNADVREDAIFNIHQILHRALKKH